MTSKFQHRGVYIVYKDDFSQTEITYLQACQFLSFDAGMTSLTVGHCRMVSNSCCLCCWKLAITSSHGEEEDGQSRAWFHYMTRDDNGSSCVFC